MARSNFAVACTFAFFAACTRPAVSPDASVPLAVDAGRPLHANQAVPRYRMLLKQALCVIPDGGAVVSSFDHFQVSNDDRALLPLWEIGAAGRSEVLRQLDAGTLTFPIPHHVVRTTPEGWFEIPAAVADGIVVVECADQVLYEQSHPASKRNFDPAVAVNQAWPIDQLLPRERVVIVDPWLRRVSTNDTGVYPTFAWATTLGEQWDLKPPDRRHFVNDLRTLSGERMIDDRPRVDPPNAVTLSLRVDVRGIERRRFTATLMTADGGAFLVHSDADGYNFRVSPGPTRLRVKMDDAKPVELDTTQGEVVVTMEPNVAATGRVVDQSGQLINEAFVFDENGAGVTTDLRGEFRFDGTPKGLRARHPEFGISALLDAGDQPLIFTLVPQGLPSIRVTAPDGGVVFGRAMIDDFANSLIRNSVLPLAGVSADAGHTLTVMTHAWKVERVVIDPKKPMPKQIVLSEKPVIDGIVMSEGKPVSGARVKVSSTLTFDYLEAETVTDQLGHFTLPCSQPGKVKVSINLEQVEFQVPSTVLVDLPSRKVTPR